MTNPTPLSPAAQAVLDAHDNAPWENFANADRLAVAAALRAAAERAGQVPAHPVNTDWEKGVADGARLVYRELLNIAAELEALTPQPPSFAEQALDAWDRLQNELAAELDIAAEPEGPTDEEIMGLMPQQMHDDLATAARGMASMALGADNTRVRGAMRITLNRRAVDLARAVLARWGNHPVSPDSSPQPIPVSERLPEPGVKVLAHYLNELGNGRTVCAIWVPAKSCADDGDLDSDDFLEYDEEDDKFFWPEGWYEAIENWEELGWVKIYEGEIVYWQPLPKWPAHAVPLPEAQA